MRGGGGSGRGSSSFGGGGRSSYGGGRSSFGGSGSYSSGPELQEKLKRAAARCPVVNGVPSDNHRALVDQGPFDGLEPEERCRRAMQYLNKVLDRGGLSPLFSELFDEWLHGCPDAPDFTDFRRNFYKY